MSTLEGFLLYSMLTCAWRRHKRENEDMRRHVRRVA